MTDCTHKTLLGRPACRFEPRYDRGPARPFGRISAEPATLTALAETRRQVTYVRDVCTRCGKTIERQSKESV